MSIAFKALHSYCRFCGTAAITTRGLVEEDMETIVALIDKVLSDHTNEEIIEEVANEVNEMMSERAIFVF